MSSSLAIPTSYEDTSGIIALADRLLDQGQHHRWLLDRDMFRNILFYLGVQWIDYDLRNRVWLPRAAKKSIPNPVTNKFAEVQRPIVSLLAGEEPNLYYRPRTDAEEDISTAFVASRAMDVITRETGLRDRRVEAARWLCLTGNVFLLLGYDPVGNGTTDIPLYGCPTCPSEQSAPRSPMEMEEHGDTCPQCAAPLQSTGQSRPYPRGRVYTEIVPPFEMHADLEATSFEDSPWKMRVTARSRSWLAAAYGEERVAALPARTGASMERGRYFMESLAYATASTGSFLPGRGSGQDERIRVRQLWFEHPSFPEGLHSVIAGETVMHAGKFPYKTADTGQPMWEGVHIGYEFVPGRLFYRTPADDAAVLQIERNKLQAALQLFVRRMANAVWLLPEGSHVSKISGEQGLVIRYNPLTSGARPERLQGNEVSRTIIEYMQLLDASIEAAMGAYDVVRGEAPARVSAYAAIQLLEQRGQQGFSEMLVNWANGHLRWAQKALGIFKEFGVDDRFIDALGENGRWAMQKFSNADLRGGLRIEVEAGLGRPRTQVGKRAVLEQAIRLGLLNPMDPQERFHALELLGFPEVMKDYDLDKQAAARENDKFFEHDAMLRTMAEMSQQDPNAGAAMVQQAFAIPWPTVKNALDNHIIHLQIHRRLGISDRFDTLAPLTQQALLTHIEAHSYALMLSQAGQMQGQGAPLKSPGPATGDGSEGEGVNEAEGQAMQAPRGEQAGRSGHRAPAPGSGEGGSVRGR